MQWFVNLMEELGIECQVGVLAPKAYYCDYDLGWFEKKLSDGIATFVAAKVKHPQWRGRPFKVDFKFTAFPADFQWDKGVE